MPESIAETRDDLLGILAELTAVGQDYAAILPAGRYDTLRFAVCPDPDGDWWLIDDPSGDNHRFDRSILVTSIPDSGPYTVFYGRASYV